MGKIPCIECGALILPTTAESTGGVCMACKQGIRKNITASRAFYQKMKAYDPFRELWVSLVHRSSDDPTLKRWLVQERAYYCVSLLEGEVYNGGFDQYFSNSSGDLYSCAINGLEELGATNSLRLTREAAQAFFEDGGPPNSQADRWHIMKQNVWSITDGVAGREKASYLDKLDKQFSGDPDKLGDLLVAYAKKHGLVDPFER